MRSDALRRLAVGLSVLLLASCYEGDPSAFRESVVVGRENVTALSVSAPAGVVETGTSLRLVATATTASGTSDLSAEVSWHSSNPAALFVDAGGLVTALADGTATISATLGVYSASVVVTASSAQLVSIQVTGDAVIDECDMATYTAAGLYEDGTERDVTSLATWSSSDPAVARTGTLAGEYNLLLARNTGTVSLTATRGAVSSTGFVVTVADNLDALVVTPDSSPVMNPGETRQFTATGTWGTRQADISRATGWTVTNVDATAPAVAAVINGDTTPGLLTGRTGGDGVLTATCGGQSDSVDIAVVVLEGLVITNTRPIELSPGQSLLLALEGSYSNASTRPLNEEAEWSTTTVSGTGVTVSTTEGSRGRVTAGSAAGVSTVTARVEGREVSVSVTVTE